MRPIIPAMTMLCAEESELASCVPGGTERLRLSPPALAVFVTFSLMESPELAPVPQTEVRTKPAFTAPGSVMLRCSAKQTARSSTTVRAVFKRENLNIRSPLEKNRPYLIVIWKVRSLHELTQNN